jgi:hypothetical protein
MSGEITESSDEMVIHVSNSVKLEVDDIMSGKLENIGPSGPIPAAIVMMLKLLKICHEWRCDDIDVGPTDDIPVRLECKSGWKLIIKKCN